jgi:hypothetical protein
MKAASAKTASVAASASAATSGRFTRLNHADCRKYEQGYKGLPHRAFSIGTISLPKIRHFLRRSYSAIERRSGSTECEPKQIDRRPDDAAKDSMRSCLGLQAKSANKSSDCSRNDFVLADEHPATGARGAGRGQHAKKKTVSHRVTPLVFIRA